MEKSRLNTQRYRSAYCSPVRLGSFLIYDVEGKREIFELFVLFPVSSFPV